MGLFSGFAGPAIGAIGSLFQSGQNARVARENTDKTIEANLNLARYQYSKDLEMWNRANTYNSPQQQMARFQQAGLNPNLIYSQGTSGLSPNALPKYQAPNVQYNYEPSTNLPQTLSFFQDYQVKQAQIDNLKANEERTRADIVLKGLINQDKTAQNYFNFGGRDLKDTIGSGGGLWNYDAKQRMLNTSMKFKMYQEEVARQIVDDQVLKIRLENQSTGLQNQIAQKNVNWYVTNQVMKALGVVGAGALGGQLLRKAPKYYKNQNNYFDNR